VPFGAALIVLSVPAAAGPTVPELVEVADMTSLSASPSGRKVVFRVERASIDRNSYQLDWYVADLETGTTLRIAGGGAPIEGGGEPLAVEPVVWSPDERFVFHRALVDGTIGIWRTATDGSGTRPVVTADADVESLATGSDPGTLTYVLGPSREDIARAERREYDEGILVDGSVDLLQNLYRGGWVNGRLASQRLTGQWYSRAGLLWQAPRQRHRLDLRTLETRRLAPVDPPAVSPLATDAGTVMALDEPGRPPVRVRREGRQSAIELDGPGGALSCTAAACRSVRVSAIAWRPDTDELAFTTHDGHFRQSLHLWNVTRGSVRTAVRTEGLVAGSRDPSRPCAFTATAAVCVTATAVAPPRLERIDLASGVRSVLFDPNALLRQRETARVEQLAWTLADGRQATGTVLLPRDAPAAAPLFVSYYGCPGYLRGGIGDEFPFAPLVDAGFVVACLNTVPADKVDIVAEYETALASVRGIVALLAGRGLVDPDRVGMGGLSFGSEVTMWVSMNSDLLAAAAIASPQYSPSGYWSSAMPGRDFAEVLRAFIGLGSPDETPERWRLVSPALNAERIEAPLLMQLPENEARFQAEVFSRLAVTSTPVELYAFPDERHVKIQPRHRLASYRRSLDWFRYWLQGYADPDPAKAAQYRRWDALRMRRDEAQRSNERSQASAADNSISRR
jgi:dipeptidyl aminopeptidase/acylaminoacyl peptidase